MKGTMRTAGVILLAALGASGCARDSSAPAGAKDATGAAPPATSATGTTAARKPAAPSNTKVYFDFDSHELDRTDVQAIDPWAKYLAANADARAVLAGHCDERGTPDYNMALGERRANAVRDYLMASGVGAGQLSVISHGENRPAAAGHGEAAWSQNRRVEFNLQP